MAFSRRILFSARLWAICILGGLVLGAFWVVGVATAVSEPVGSLAVSARSLSGNQDVAASGRGVDVLLPPEARL
jgi:hypothetical protein